MKKSSIKILGVALICSTLLTSCYTYTSVVGSGAKGNEEVSAWNHYIFWGLAPVGVSDSKKMADGATDYNIQVQHSFVNGLLQVITFGIYTPTTTTVRK